MALTRKHKRWIIILGSILLLLIILIIFANRMISGKADTLLRNELSKVDSTEYVIDFDRVRINIFNRSASLHGIRITPSETLLEKTRRSPAPPPVIEAVVDRVKVTGIGIMAIIKGKAINIGGVFLREPDIRVYGKGNLLKHKSQKNGNGGLFESDTTFGGQLNGASLGSFEISHAQFAYIDLTGNDTSIFTKDLSISLDEIDVRQLSGDSLANSLTIEDINIEIRSHFMELPGGFYSLMADGLSVNYKEGEFSLDSLKLIPAYPIGSFGKAYGKQTDRFDIDCGKISISGIAFDSLMSNKFIAKGVVLTNPRADICRDKRVARDMSIFPKLFQTALAEMPLKIYVGSVNTVDAYLKYQEILEGAKHPGMVILSDLNMNINGICNYTDSIRNGQAINVDATARLMSHTPLQMHFYLPIGNHSEYFTFHGNAGSFPVTKLNPTLENMVYVEATGGTVDGVEFYGMAMNDTAAGRIEFRYSDLSMSVLKKKKEQEGVIVENKFLSFVARTAMHKSNPHPGKDPRIAKMSFVRDPNKGFFNYFWKTLQNGIIVTLTPGKKNLAVDMGWGEFKKDWRKVLLDDWNALQVKNLKKEKDTKRNRK
jgi:hypothetical protein